MWLNVAEHPQTTKTKRERQIHRNSRHLVRYTSRVGCLTAGQHVDERINVAHVSVDLAQINVRNTICYLSFLIVSIRNAQRKYFLLRNKRQAERVW